MNDKETTASYVELSKQATTHCVDAFASANQRALDYTKSVWEIVSRPYSSAAIETVVRENFDRTNQIVSLTIAELQTTGQKSAEFGEKLVSHGAKLQETNVHSLRGMVNTGLSNLNYVKDTATQSFEDITKRIDDIGNRTAAQVSSN